MIKRDCLNMKKYPYTVIPHVMRDPLSASCVVMDPGSGSG